MLRNVKVAKYISERMQERQERTEVTQDKVIMELARKDLVRFQGDPFKLKQIEVVMFE